jgi:phosphonate transport system substrate-binding protein
MSELRRRTGLLAGAGWLCLSALPRPVPAQVPVATRRLQLGLLPITSTRALLKNYQPVQAYLERELGQPVELVTATDFRAFQTQTLRGQYDVIVTASHLGRQAQLDAGYLPLARYRALHRTLLLTARDRPLKDIGELRGRSISGPDALTLASIETQAWLQGRGLRAGADYTFIATATPPSAAQAVLNRQAVLTISTPQGMKNTPEDLREQLEVFATLPEIPSLMWLAHPSLGALLPRLKAVLLAFSAESAESRAFFEATGYAGLREVQTTELNAVDVYLPHLREQLKAGR